MPDIAHVTLAETFPSIFTSSVTLFTNETIRKMIDLAPYDSMSGDCYKFDAAIAGDTLSSKYEKNSGNTGYVLYYRAGSMVNGTECWAPVSTANDAIVNAREVYLRIPSSDRYVRIYDLVHFDVAKVVGQTTAFYAAAALAYAMSCMQMKQLELNVTNLEQLNDELLRLNKVLTRLSSIKDELSTKDKLVEDVNNLNTKDMTNVKVDLDGDTIEETKIIDFLKERLLLDSGLMKDGNVLNANQISFWSDSLRIYYEQCNGVVNRLSSEMQRNSSESSQCNTFVSNTLQSRGKVLSSVTGNLR